MKPIIREAIGKAREKTKILEGERKDRLQKAIDRLEEITPDHYLIENPIINEREQKRVADVFNYRNQYNRTFLNNERKGIDSEIIKGVLDRFYMIMPDLLEAVERFAENGDPLAIKIRSRAEELKDLQGGSDEAIYQLINRKMTESDYNDFLNGELAIYRGHGEDVYLK